jgi:hypothetical protein
MTAFQPFIVGAELETREIGILLDGVDRAHELVYIHAIDEGWGLGIHGLISFLVENRFSICQA